MAEIVCPECGLVTSLNAIRRAADEFCPHCDFPLFWAPAAAPLVAGSMPNDATLRRLPGRRRTADDRHARVPAVRRAEPDVGGLVHPLRLAAAPGARARAGAGARAAAPAAAAAAEPEPRSWWWLWVLLTAVVGVVGVVLLILAMN